MFKEYQDYDAIGLAELLTRGEVTAGELVETAIYLIEKHNPALNSVIHKTYEMARSAATQPHSGPLFGIPFLLKDLKHEQKNVPLRNGSKAFNNYIPTIDSELIKRYRNAGLIFLGKTNTPEFGMAGVTEPELFGATANPYDLLRSPGGSSGGSAAAVAARLVPIASASDGGGSIRAPASCCNLFGMKPSRARNPNGPRGEGWAGASCEHVLSRTVRDSALLLDLTAGPDIGSRIWPPKQEGSFLKACTEEPKKLRIAFSAESPIGGFVHEDCKQALKEAVELLQGLGHEVEEAKPEIDGMELALAFFTVFYAQATYMVEQSALVLGRKPRASDFEFSTWILARLGSFYSAKEYIEATEVCEKAAREMGRFHQKYDFYMTPTVASPPWKTGSLKTKTFDRLIVNTLDTLRLMPVVKWSGAVEKLALKNIEKAPFAAIANQTGQPAISVPLYMTKEGLPIGIQFIGPIYSEARLFQLAGQLERAKPWIHIRPEGFGM